MKNLADPVIRRSLAERIARLGPGSPRRWGRMTPHQMICHLSDSFRACLAEKAVSSATGPVQRTLIKWIALYLPLPWPKGIPTRPEVEQGVGGTPPAEFEADRNDLLGLLERFTTSTRRSPHPIFGHMSEAEWRRWGYLHVDHHLRQFGV
jgi:hypothetical protein